MNIYRRREGIKLSLLSSSIKKNKGAKMDKIIDITSNILGFTLKLAYKIFEFIFIYFVYFISLSTRR